MCFPFIINGSKLIPKFKGRTFLWWAKNFNVKFEYANEIMNLAVSIHTYLTCKFDWNDSNAHPYKVAVRNMLLYKLKSRYIIDANETTWSNNFFTNIEHTIHTTLLIGKGWIVVDEHEISRAKKHNPLYLNIWPNICVTSDDRKTLFTKSLCHTFHGLSDIIKNWICFFAWNLDINGIWLQEMR